MRGHQRSIQGMHVAALCQVVSILGGCAGKVIEPPSGEEPSGQFGEPVPQPDEEEPSEREPAPQDPPGRETGGQAGTGGPRDVGGQGGAGPDSFSLITTGVGYEPTVSENAPDVTTYLLHLGPANTTVRAVMGGDEIVTGVTGLLEVRLLDCVAVGDMEEECLLRVVQIGGSPSGSDADMRLTGYSFRSDFEGIATRTADGFRSTIHPDGLILDMNKVLSEYETSYHGLNATEISFDCMASTCNVEAAAL